MDSTGAGLVASELLPGKALEMRRRINSWNLQGRVGWRGPPCEEQ